VEPSQVMIDQRPSDSAPPVRAMAENLPLGTDSVDATLAVLTAHHWDDLSRGLAELTRVARHRVVVLTWDHTVTKDFWLLRDYLPGAAATDARLAIPIDRFGELPGTVSISPVLVPHDCVDGFAGAYWRRREAYHLTWTDEPRGTRHRRDRHAGQEVGRRGHRCRSSCARDEPAQSRRIHRRALVAG
jgi:hypothetical protein